jgi:hypothetical protein
MPSHWIRRIIPIILGATAIAAAVAAPSVAADQPNFDIHTSGQVGFTIPDFTCPPSPLPPPFVPIRIFGVAPAPAYGTHIGDVGDGATLSISECATPSMDPTVNNIDGHATVTAPNGDQIFIHYYGPTGALFPDFSKPCPTAQLSDDLAFDITGGTGHFAGASGHGRLTAGGTVYFCPTPTIVTSEFKGTISMHSH